MMRLERFQISNFWGAKNLTLDLHSKFVILTGYNGSGKSTILELLHDSFSLAHDGDVESIHESWASEISFSDGTLVRNYFMDFDIDLHKELKKKLTSVARNTINSDIFKSFESINRTINNNLNKKNNELVVKTDSSSSAAAASFLSMRHNPAKKDIIMPKTILFKDNRVFYNKVSVEDKEVKELAIFNATDSIDKTLYLLINAFIIQEAKNKKNNFKNKNKNELKYKLIEELKSDEMFGTNTNTSDDELISKIEGLVERVFLAKGNHTSWGKELFAVINEFLKKTHRSVVRDENGFVAFKRNNGSVVKWYNFSRGEKTLLVLLLSVFLNKNEDVIFILDEPDLSLHIEWQEILLPNLARLAPDRQFILSTHSPALIGNVEEQYFNIAAMTE
ncbi:TPA: AAA family ATPase [Escherichia coli]|nr:AAA family ATPase [Escherichia coli]